MEASTYRERFFSGPFQYMNETMTGLLARKRAISENIANVNNPNYHPIHVKFEDQLEEMYHKFWREKGLDGDEMTIEPVKLVGFDPEFNEGQDDGHVHPQIIRDPVGRVDLNHEMAEMYKTQMMYWIVAENNRPNYGRDVLDQMLK